MLLVNDGQTQIEEFHLLLNQRMSAYHNLSLSALQFGVQYSAVGSFGAAGQQSHVHSEVAASG